MIPHPHIAALSGYALADLAAPAGQRVISLAQNESLRPPSPAALLAAQEALGDSALYPDAGCGALRQALGTAHSIDPNAIVCGAGSLDLIAAVVRIYTGPERALLIPAHSYPFFAAAGALAGARVDLAPEADAHVDVDALLAAVRPDTGLVCVANPANPTGTWLPLDEIVRLRDGLRDDILLVLDEAYGEFAPQSDGARSGFDMVGDGKTLLSRTFSKAYGLAGLRVGWAVAPPAVVHEIGKVLNPNGISAPAQAAACAALADQIYLEETVAQTALLRESTTAALQSAGFRVLPSHTNFVTIDCETEARAIEMDAALRADGIVLRRQGAAGLPQMLRMTLGPPDDVAQAQARFSALAEM